MKFILICKTLNSSVNLYRDFFLNLLISRCFNQLLININ